MMVKITGGKKHERRIVHEVVAWCFNYYKIKTNINVKIGKFRDYDCWGTCVEDEEKSNKYHITVANDQNIRDFIATIVHEMIHIKQFVTGKCRGDGEKECEKLQYKLTDKLWKKNII
jgi:hypothetical protein